MESPRLVRTNENVDFVLVWEKQELNGEANQENQARRLEMRNYFEKNLAKEGVLMDSEEIKDEDKVLTFVMLYLPWDILCKQAENLHTKSPLQVRDFPTKIRGHLKWYQKLLWYFPKGHENEVGDFTQTATKKVIKQRLHGKNCIIFWPFKRKHLKRYAIVDENTFFSEQQRSGIAYHLLQSVGNDPSAPGRRGIEALLEKGVYDKAFPLHNSIEQEKLRSSWASWNRFFRKQPLDNIRLYFGEKIGFYFAFLDCYTKMLFYLAVVCLTIFGYSVYEEQTNPELSSVCKNDTSNGSDPYNVANFLMCPICKPPNCDVWKMANGGCNAYRWSLILDNGYSIWLTYIGPFQA